MSASTDWGMSRRGFLTAVTTGIGTTVATSGTTTAQDGTTTGNETTSASGNTTSGNETSGTETAAAQGQGGGGTVTVELGNYYFRPGTEEPLYIKPGTTVKFVWKTGGHNIHVDSQPEGANWKGHEPIEGKGFTYKHTFKVKGKYHYWCVPHKSLGMVADLIVNESGQPPGGGGGGQKEVDPEEMGVPLQSHYVGIATVLAIITTLVFTFYTLKYAVSPHANSPNRD